VSVGCVAGIMLDFDLAGVGKIIFLAMVALCENHALLSSGVTMDRGSWLYFS